MIIKPKCANSGTKEVRFRSWTAKIQELGGLMNDYSCKGSARGEIICERSIRIFGEVFLLRYGIYCSSYGEDVQEEEEDFYGIGIWQYRRISTFEYELYDRALVEGFSERYQETRLFMHLLYKGLVLPMSLEEIVDDWQSAFCKEPAADMMIEYRTVGRV